MYFLLRFPSGSPGWSLTSALLCGVRTFLDEEPCDLHGVTQRDPAAATWLALSVYHPTYESLTTKLTAPGGGAASDSSRPRNAT